jgi:hypothetical protein
MIEALSLSETSVLTRAARPNIPDDGILQTISGLSLPYLLPFFVYLTMLSTS